MLLTIILAIVVMVAALVGAGASIKRTVFNEHVRMLEVVFVSYINKNIESNNLVRVSSGDNRRGNLLPLNIQLFASKRGKIITLEELKEELVKVKEVRLEQNRTKREAIARLLKLQAKTRYELENMKKEDVDHIAILYENKGLDSFENEEFINTFLKANDNATTLELVKVLNSLGVEYFSNNTKFYLDEVENGVNRYGKIKYKNVAKYKGRYFGLVSKLSELRNEIKMFTDEMSWENKGKILKFFGFIDIERDLDEDLVNDEYNMFHQIHSGTGVSGDFEESIMLRKVPFKESNTLKDYVVLALKDNKLRKVDTIKFDDGSLYYVFTINDKEGNLYVPAEIGGVLKVNGNTLIRRTHLITNNKTNKYQVYHIMNKLIEISLKSSSKMASAYNLSNQFLVNALQNRILGLLYKQEIFEGNKLNLYSFISDNNIEANKMLKLIESHTYHFVKSVFDLEVDDRTSLKNLRSKGIYDMHDLKLDDSYTEFAYSDIVSTAADNIVTRFDDKKVPLISYFVGKRLAKKLHNGGRAALATNVILKSMPLRNSDGSVVPFDKRTETDITEMPEEFKGVDTNLGYYVYTVDMKFKSKDGWIAHEGQRLFNKEEHKRGWRQGNKADDGLGNKGMIVIFQDELYFYYKGIQVPISIYEHSDAVGQRKNIASVVAGLEAAEREFGKDKNIFEVFTVKDGKEVSLGKQAISKTYFYKTDQVRGSLSSYRDTTMVKDYVRKDKIHKVRIGQEQIVKLALSKNYDSIIHFFGGLNKLNATIDFVEKELEDKDKFAHKQQLLQSKLGKYGILTRMLQPKVSGIHATAMANADVPTNEMWLYASKTDAESVLNAFNIKGGRRKYILNSNETTHIISQGIGSRHPMIRLRNMIPKSLRLIIVDDEAYDNMYFGVNPITHSMMDGDFDGDEVFFYRVAYVKAFKELQETLTPTDNEINNYKDGWYNREFREWTNLDDYMKDLFKIKGSKEFDYKHELSDEKILTYGAPTLLSTLLSKRLIGRAKGGIMQFELSVASFILENNLNDDYLNRLLKLVENLNITYSQAAIDVQKWTARLEDAMRLNYSIAHLNRLLTTLVDGEIINLKSQSYTMKYFFKDKTGFDTFYEYEKFIRTGDFTKTEIYLLAFDSFGTRVSDYLEPVTEEFIVNGNVQLVSYLKVKPNKFKLRLDEPTVTVNRILNFVENDLRNTINKLVEHEDIKEGFFFKSTYHQTSVEEIKTKEIEPKEIKTITIPEPTPPPTKAQPITTQPTNPGLPNIGSFYPSKK